MTINSTDISLAFGNKKRLRTQNYRGSLITNTITLTAAQGTTGVTALMPIPYSSSIKSIKIGCGAISINPAAIVSIGIRGINRDYTPGTATTFNDASLTTINDTALRAASATTATANSWTELLAPANTANTIYDLLCKNVNGYRVPIDAFKPYKDDRYGMLTITISGGSFDQPSYFQVEYVDGSPSTSTLNTLTVEK